MTRHRTICLSWIGYVILFLLVLIFLVSNRSETQAWFLLIGFALPQMGISLYLNMWLLSGLDRHESLFFEKITSITFILINYFATIGALGLVYIGRLKDGGEITKSIYTALYFSIVTITTTGYGDVVPMHGIARIAAAREALLGFFFLVLLSALTVKLANSFRPR